MVLHEEFHRHMAYFVRSLVTYGTVTEVVDQDFQRSGEELLAAILGAYHISRPKEGGKSAKNEV